MIVDTSAIMAILLCEPDMDTLKAALFDAAEISMSAGSWIELEAVLVLRKIDGVEADTEQLFRTFGISILPVSVQQARIARDAYRRYGRGTGHPARLNFGDCFAYALAKERGEPLLFKGDDFAQTDVRAAL